MTHDKIMAMDEAGLRLEVARALGWRLLLIEDETAFISSRYKVLKPGQEYQPKETEKVSERPLREDRIVLALCLNWPRDIDAAWGLAVEAHISIVPVMDYTTDEIIGYMAQQTCIFDKPDPSAWFERNIGSWFFGPTAPIAICRAWLAWKAGL